VGARQAPRRSMIGFLCKFCTNVPKCPLPDGIGGKRRRVRAWLSVLPRRPG
jgi:hypothetical protein